MSFTTQPGFAIFDQMSDSDSALAQATTMQQQQQQFASMAMDGRGAPPQSYFINGQMLGAGGMYGVSPLAVETPQVSAALMAASTGGAVGAEGRRRSPTNGSSRSSAGADHAQRRATHNAIERARRESLNGQFQDLASAVPALIHVRRPSKATIVEKSLDYIRTFKDHLGNRDQYIKKLQLRNLALHDEVNRLRSQLGLEPLSEVSEPQSDGEEPETMASSSADSSMDTEEEAVAKRTKKATPKAGSPLRTVVTAANLDAISAPADADSKIQSLQKRRQHSLDLSMAGQRSTGRPALRVHTAHFPGAAATNDSALTVAAAAAAMAPSGSSSSSSPLLYESPLSAPLLTHAPQMPYHQGSEDSAQAFAAAAAFVAHTSQQSLQTMPVAPLTAAQLSAFGMSMPSLSSSLQVSSMGGYLASGAVVPSIGAMDMSKLSEVFAVSSATPAIDMAAVQPSGTSQ
ncbi:hypothetical protein GGF46_003934 [Coemansia sp. RSA 552]|nr:hypothetical protein GGF46_003934 [Coemansia sp. RSA 552]